MERTFTGGRRISQYMDYGLRFLNPPFLLASALFFFKKSPLIGFVSILNAPLGVHEGERG